ncbi:hypothetical protein B296_00042607 [Ensete ventricosum]|uniref:Uncharacterized protein n=1 Tax=Ensete ventricosum TaxID=4639 RepID=A0A426ZHW2_ENSVE|nr:hypothetical protein B296_00042607 [Ensete ventricosum]
MSTRVRSPPLRNSSKRDTRCSDPVTGKKTTKPSLRNGSFLRIPSPECVGSSSNCGLAWAVSRAGRSIPRPLRLRRLRLDGLLLRLHTLRPVKPPRHSSAFADRPVKESSAYELLFHRAMGFAPFGEYSLNLRRIAAFGEHRKTIGQQMIQDVMASTGTNGGQQMQFGPLQSKLQLSCLYGTSHLALL